MTVLENACNILLKGFKNACNLLLGEHSPFRQTSASTAKERLKIVVLHQRGEAHEHDYLKDLQEDLIKVIAKYVHVDKDSVRVELQRNEDRSVLELCAVLPENNKPVADSV